MECVHASDATCPRGCAGAPMARGKFRSLRGIGVFLQVDYRTINHIAATALAVESTGARRSGGKSRSARLIGPMGASGRRLAIAIAACLAMVLPAAGAPAPKDKAAPKIVARIAFAGDSIVDNYWESIVRVIEANPCLKATVALGRFARNGTGLSRGDKLYWPREVRKIGETFKPDLFVLSIGLNDQQFIV